MSNITRFVICIADFILGSPMSKKRARGRSQLMRWSPPDQWSKIALVHCGVDGTFLETPLQLPPSAPRFVCVGRIGEHKAQLILVGAVRRLRESGIECEVLLVGDGPMRAQVERATQRAGLEHQISITGWVSADRVKAEIVAARALILPSFSENMPVVIMEAMALGRPVISTYIAGIPELVQPEVNGWLVPAGDEDALGEALSQAIAAPIDRLIAMGAAGRERVIEYHDVLKEAKKLKDLFDSVT